MFQLIEGSINLYKRYLNYEDGVVHILILIAAIGLIAFLVIANLASFKDKLLNSLFPKPSSHAAEPVKTPSTPDEILVKFRPGVTSNVKNITLRQHGLTSKDTIPNIGVIVAKVPEKAKDKVLQSLSHNPNIQYAEPNYISKVEATPNDPYYLPRQSNLQKINMGAAWDITKGSSIVPVGVIDSGANATVPDLVGKILPGASFVSYTTSTDDDQGHGTSVSGVIGAATDNSTGVAGLGWNTPVVPLKACDSNATCNDSDVASAIIYAADHGIKSINMSLGGSGFSQATQDASNYAWSKGVVLSGASGNNGTLGVVYPAANQNVIAVGGVDGNDNIASFSNYGPGIDVVAPGLGIYATEINGTYAAHAGTSYTSPHVAALAALIFAANSNLTNRQVVDIILKTASKTGSYNGTLLNYTSDTNTDNCDGWNQYSGCGRIDAAKAVQAAANTTVTPDTESPTAAITSPTGGTVVGTVPISVLASDNIGVTKVELYIDNNLFASINVSPYNFNWDSTSVSDGSHIITTKSYDLAGNAPGTASVNVTVNNLIPDITPPAISITSPTNGSTVSNSVNIIASASDNVAVSSVSFLVDGIFISQLTTSPYSISWDTTQFSNGIHNITVLAVDPSNNLATSPVISVTTSNSQSTSTPTVNPTPTPTPVTTSVVISGITFNTTATSATISWLTNVPTTSLVNYGLTTSLGTLTPLNTNLTTNHSITITSLKNSSRYYFKVYSKDSLGLETSSSIQQLRTKSK